MCVSQFTFWLQKNFPSSIDSWYQPPAVTVACLIFVMPKSPEDLEKQRVAIFTLLNVDSVAAVGF